MSGIFGIVNRDGAPVRADAIAVMRREMADWGRDGGGTWHDGPAAVGLVLRFDTPEARLDRLPSWEADRGLAFTAAGRVDNRDELASALGLGAERSGLSDGELIRRAHARWGDASPKRIFGDWSFAAWDARAHGLLLARDHCGNTALYYHASPRVFAFASSRRALLALDLAPRALDELYLGQILINWTAYHGERTVHAGVKRLPPAHTLAVTAGREELRRYWRLEDTPPLPLASRRDCVLGLRDVFDRAVRDRLRSEGAIGVTLSGGLDSSSVTVTAAAMLAEQGRRLAAFTAIPRYPTEAYVGSRFGDEIGLARATAAAAGNVDLDSVPADMMTPVQGMRRALAISLEPLHAACNMFWLLDLNRAAAARGCRTLLTGQQGNGGVSWKGLLSSQPFGVQLRQLGWSRWLRSRLGRHVPQTVTRALRRRRAADDWINTPINRSVARRLDLMARKLDDPAEYASSGRHAERCRVIRPGKSFLGAIHAEQGAAAGLDIRDPTADARVLAYCLSVPDRFYFDPTTGLDRALIRDAMVNRLPGEVRLNPRRGRQAADLVQRLRESAGEVDRALAAIANGAGAEYVEMDLLHHAWATIQVSDSPESFHFATRVLTRGIMAGLFVNGFSTSQFDVVS